MKDKNEKSPDDFLNEENVARFMGAEVITSYADHRLMDFGHGKERFPSWPGNQRYVATSCLRYGTSWDQLYPVILKLKNTQAVYGEYDCNRLAMLMADLSEIGKVYKCVCEIVKERLKQEA